MASIEITALIVVPLPDDLAGRADAYRIAADTLATVRSAAESTPGDVTVAWSEREGDKSLATAVMKPRKRRTKRELADNGRQGAVDGEADAPAG